MTSFKKTQFGIFKVSDRKTITISGDILERTPNDLRKLMRYFPEVEMLIFQNCPGSEDDDAVFEAGRLIREKGMNTLVPNSGIIESGAVELFMSGVKRVIESGAKVGVHTWEDEGTGKFAVDFPRGHKEHRSYLKYYKEMGIPEEFYYFTIQAATYNNMYYLSEEEIKSFNLIN